VCAQRKRGVVEDRELRFDARGSGAMRPAAGIGRGMEESGLCSVLSVEVASLKTKAARGLYAGAQPFRKALLRA